MARGEIHVELAVDFADDPKVRALSRFGRDARPARDLYVQMICYCKRKLTDGFVPAEQLGLLVYPDPPALGQRDVERLAEVGLVEACDAGWTVLGFLKRNRSAAQVRATIDAKAEAATRGNHERWHARRGVSDPTCSLCSQTRSSTDRIPDPVAIADPIGPANRSESTETETETETEKKNLPSPATPPRGRSRPADDPPEFTRFWAEYPRRVDKGHARKAWASKVAKANVDVEDVVKRAKKFAEDCARNGTAAEYIPHPATWLNGERWADQPSTITSSEAGDWWDN